MECTFCQRSNLMLRTPGVIYGAKGCVHPVYMAKKPNSQARLKSQKMRPRRPDGLRWRRTQIGLHRESKQITQQQMADRLAERGIELDRVSVSRIEAGKQMPTAETLEAMALILRTDLDSMLNLTPQEAEELARLRAMEPRERDRMLRAVRAAIGGGE